MSIEQLIQENTAALKELAAAIYSTHGRLTATPVEAPCAAAKTAALPATPVAPPIEAPAETEITLLELNTAFKDVLVTKGRESALAILKILKADAISKIDKKDWRTAITLCAEEMKMEAL